MCHNRMTEGGAAITMLFWEVTKQTLLAIALHMHPCTPCTWMPPLPLAWGSFFATHHHWPLIYGLSHVSACRGLKSRSPLRAHLHVDAPYAYSDAFVKTLDNAVSSDVDYLVSCYCQCCPHGVKQLCSHASHLPHADCHLCRAYNTVVAVLPAIHLLSAVLSATQGQCVLCTVKKLCCADQQQERFHKVGCFGFGGNERQM